MFFSYKDTKEKLDYLEASEQNHHPINTEWLIRTLRQLNEKHEQQQQEIEELQKDKKGLMYRLDLEIKHHDEVKKQKSFYQNRVKYLEGMIDEGLGWDDVKTE